MERRRPHCGIQMPHRKINGNKLVDIRRIPSPGQEKFFGRHELILSKSIDEFEKRMGPGRARVLYRGTARQCWDWAWDHGYFIWGLN